MQTIAIIGAGFSGTMVAVHLLQKQLHEPTTIVLIERTGRFTAGIAYGTSSSSHVLNVPAGRMSAFPDDPEHFLRWARSREGWITGGTFVPRMMYREYLAETLDEAEQWSKGKICLMRIPAEALLVRMNGDSATIELGGGGRVNAEHVVLSIGNFPPADPPLANVGFYSSARYARDPWSTDALELPRDDAVLLLGTGLTMLDIALALRDRGQQGVIYALSRRGLMPQPHRDSAHHPSASDRPEDLDRWPGNALAMLRALRKHVRAAADNGVDWREIITSIRADTPALWQKLDQRERRRFLRHLRPFWETHRHRSAPSSERSIRAMINSHRLQIIAGRLVNVHEFDRGVEVTIAPRGMNRQDRLHVSKVINCTGPDTDLTTVKDPLMQNLRRLGLVRPDALGLGLDTNEHGSLVDADGRVNERLHLVGPLRKGQLWENTAVPELRVEASRMAARIAALCHDAAGSRAPSRS
jgi:uncharacterized NAD(P)/FAD-binding protein YdhS